MVSQLELHREHPEFSLSMELLCLLPCEPAEAWVEDLKCDLGLQYQAEVDHLIDALTERFVIWRAKSLNTAGCYVSVAAIGRSSWADAERVGGLYLDGILAGRTIEDSTGKESNRRCGNCGKPTGSTSGYCQRSSECRKLRAQAYRAANGKRINERRRMQFAVNRDMINARNRAHYAANVAAYRKQKREAYRMNRRAHASGVAR